MLHDQRAKERVAITLSGELNENLIKWEPVIARIILIMLELQEKISCTQIHAPTENRSVD